MTLRFHKNIYGSKALHKAISAYSEFADITMTKKGDYFLVDIEPHDKEQGLEVVFEFQNFALGESISGRFEV